MKQANRPDDVAAEGRKTLSTSAAWLEVEREFLETGWAQGVQRALAEATDRAVIEAFGSALAPVLGESAAILAAGSYARGELFPFSEAEIVIVREDEPRAGCNEAVAEFLRSLWARGVRPSNRICSARECLAAPEQNADLCIKLLDRRMLAGDAGVGRMLDDGLAASIAKHGRQLGERLAAAERARHAKYRNTPFHREPDVEETPGALRDLRLIGTLARLRPQQAGSPEALGRAAAFLSMVRCFLHYRAREDRDVLDAPAQQAVVEQFARGTEARLWMREYFSHARVVFNEARRALESVEAGAGTLAEAVLSRQSRLSNEEFTVLHGRVYLRRPGSLGADAGMVFRLIEFLARHGVPLAPETERQLEGASVIVASFCEQRQIRWPTLKAILSLPHAAGAFRALRNAGLLSSIFPDWARIEGSPADGADQLYTTDEHTLMAMERICELQAGAEPALRRFAELLSGADDHAVLLFAVLFRHMGRPQAAAALAGAAGARFEMSASGRETVEFLIEHQADLSEAVSGRDVDDPATVRALSGATGTIERLRLLTALSYADIAATHSEAMLPLRLEQLWGAYAAAERELTRELETDRIRELPASLPAETAEFITGFPMRYLRARTAAEIEAHARLYEMSRPSGVAVQLDQSGGGNRLTVVARDQPALFASLAGAISSFGLDIVKAEAFSNSRGIVLDSFVFTDPRRTLELNPPEAERLQDLIRHVASGKTEARRLFRSRPRHDTKTHLIEPQVRFDSDACETATLVEIVAEDRLGLLYSLAAVFSSNACDIDVVLVDTRGSRAIDVFYVTRGGEKLPSEVQAMLKEQLLSACRGG